MVFPAVAPDRLTHADLERMGDEIAELSAHIHAAMYELLVKLRTFDEASGWGAGFLSCAHWLSWRTGIAPGAAREKVRTARALHFLPKVSEAMRRGELSFAKVRAITRVATPENEEQLLEVARTGTAAHVEKIVRAWRRVDRLEEQFLEGERHRSRFVSLHVGDDGTWELRGRLDPEIGALLSRALEEAVESLHGRRRRELNGDGAAQRRADAIGVLAERSLGSEAASGSTGRFEVVVHVDAEALREGAGKGQSVIEGVRVSAETSRRVACDSSRVVMTHDQAGNVLDVGRRTRTVPPAIRRALLQRDKTCRFPGCDNRFCDAHHITHWADNGRTSLNNLVRLCRHHHRKVHEEGYTVEVSAGGGVEFRHPCGSVVPEVPALPEVQAGWLEERHAERGLTIGPDTTMSSWLGERMDLDLAIRTLRRPELNIEQPLERDI